MNILYLTNELSKLNGWATVGVELIAELRDQHHVIVISKKSDPHNPGHALISGDHYKNPVTLLSDARNILRKLQGQRIDAIICGIEPYLPLAALLKRKLGKPRLMLLGQGTYIYYPFVKGMRKIINRQFARSVDTLVVPSRFTFEKALTWWKGPMNIVHWGVNLNDYHPVAELSREPAFICVGALKQRKGVDLLLNAFAELSRKHPEARLYLVGSPSDKYIRRAAELGIQSQVVFTGKVSHEALLQYYSRSLCHVLVSNNTESAFEGYGLVHLEANACGIPSIGASGTANEDVIVDGYNGFLCGQDDSHQLAALMERILTNADEYTALCANSLKYAQERNWRSASQQLTALLFPEA